LNNRRNLRTSFLKPYQKLHPMAGHQNHPL